MEREYWVWYAEQGAEQARVVSKFSDEEKCKEWCEDMFDGFVEIGLSFPLWAEGPNTHLTETGLIGVVEDYTES